MPDLFLLPLVTQLFAFAPPAGQPQAAPQQTVPRITLPPVVVTAQKEPAEAQRLPVSVTAVSDEVIAAAGITTVSEAAVMSPNTRVAELSARKVSNPFVRGIGSSPANPGITTFIDGVPQLNSSSSSIELLDIEQIEVVRGPQSALFGRNTLGGLVSVASARPSLGKWNGQLMVPFGNSGAREVRASASGPVTDSLAVGVSYGHGERDGFTVNDVTGHLLDSRSADFGKAQLLWVPTAEWEVRTIVYGERARDGDYALNDLGELRARPFHAARDFEGRTERDLWSATVLVRGKARACRSRRRRDTCRGTPTRRPISTTRPCRSSRAPTPRTSASSRRNSGWRPQPAAPTRLSDRATLRWQAGLFLFSQDYAQDAVNTFGPYVLSPMLPFSVSQHSPLAALDDAGVGAYGQGTLTLDEAWDVSVGARLDSERKTARLETFVRAAARAANVGGRAAHVHGRVAAGVGGLALHAGPHVVRLRRERLQGRGLQPRVARGAARRTARSMRGTWKAASRAHGPTGGSPPTPRRSTSTGTTCSCRCRIPQVPAQFYIANVGGARSSGLEVDVNARPGRGVDLFAAAGLTRARFSEGSTSGGVDVSGNDLPNAPRYTVSLGAQFSQAVGAGSQCFGRADVVFSGAYHYDEANLEGQAAYSLVNIRAGVKARGFVAEAWVKNAFDTRYIPVAFAYGGLAPSGFLGENGRPRTFGVSVGFGF